MTSCLCQRLGQLLQLLSLMMMQPQEREADEHRPQCVFFFTDYPNPQHQRCVACKNCNTTVFHYKKCEYAKRHLLKCQPFRRLMMSMDTYERPEWFTAKRSKSSVSQSTISQRSICDYAVPPVDRKTKAKFQELIALH
uniref:Uncharacterized protein n=1 Tax=Spongospora subterranea TaxID=70186 RepID=A0A0H5RCV6_9EUKA|eukprot:CRZ06344.1 hypothetical protein [Spongospora subterranea]